MKHSKKYIRFCKKFENLKLPNLQFRKIPKNYILMYKYLYDLDVNTVKKSTFFVFSLVTVISFSILIYFIDIFYTLMFSIGLSALFSYKFNMYLFNQIRRYENLFDRSLHLIKLNFELIQEIEPKYIDKTLKFIDLLKNFDSPFYEFYETITNRILLGNSPEAELSDLLTPSKDFDEYIKILKISNFNDYPKDKFLNDLSSETQFKIHLKDIESKISVIFFIGIFFPISICIVTIFYEINFLILILLIPPLYLLMMKKYFRNIILSQNFLLGLFDPHSQDNAVFDDFITWLRSFAFYLGNNIAPERALIYSLETNYGDLLYLHSIVSNLGSDLIKISITLDDFFDSLILNLSNPRYQIILNTIKNMLLENSSKTANKIETLIKIVNRHIKLGKKLEIIIGSKKFTIYIFIFLLPLITGAICGLFPLLMGFDVSNVNNNSIEPFYLLSLEKLINIFIIFLTLIINNSISSYYFLKIINTSQKKLVILFSNSVFILTFIISFITALDLII